MIMGDTKRMIKNACGIEYTNAITEDREIRKGRYFNSLHEGYAVLLEEVEEVIENFSNLKNVVHIWELVKKNSNELLIEMLSGMQDDCQNAMAELAQIAGVCQKFIDTIEKYYGGNNNE